MNETTATGTAPTGPPAIDLSNEGSIGAFEGILIAVVVGVALFFLARTFGIGRRKPGPACSACGKAGQCAPMVPKSPK